MEEKFETKGYGRPGAPMFGYFVLTAVFVGMVVLFFLIMAAAGIDLPERIGILDMVLLGVATHKLAWLISKDIILSFVRAPFTRFDHPTGPGGVTKEKARGKGWRFAVGELLSCPWCIGQWVAALFVLFLIITPGVTRIIATIFAVLMLADFLQLIYMKFGGKMVHYSDPQENKD